MKSTRFPSFRPLWGAFNLGVGGSFLCEAVITSHNWEHRLGCLAISAAFTIIGVLIVPKPTA